MTRTAKTKTPALPTAQTREEAEDLIARHGEIQRELQRQAADLGDKLATAKQEAETRALPLKEELEDIQGRVQRWAEANRAELTGGKSKTVPLTSGVISWRQRPPSVTVRGGLDNVLAWLKSNLGGQFIRVKEELDKEALRGAPDVAITIPGIRLGSAGEDFVIEPFGNDQLESAAA